MSNGDAKILKTATEEGEAHGRQESELNGVESSDITIANKSVTEEVEAEEKERPPVSMRLAVVPERFPDDKMTEKQAEVLAVALVERIDPTAKGDPVQFSATQYESGGLVFTCVNQATKGWLHKTVPKISPWPGARLAVGQAETTLKGTKYILWLMNGMHKRSNQQIINFFQRQNSDISTAEWKIIKRVSESDTRQRIILWVDDKSSEDLKAHDFKLFLGLTRPNFLPWSEWKKQTAGNVPTKRPDRRPAVQNSAPPPTGPGFSRPPVPARGRSRGRGFSGPNPRPQIYRFDRLQRELEFADTGARHFRGAQSTASGRLSPRERGIGIPERSQFRESGYREMRRDTTYSAGRPQENGYFPPERRQPRDAGYGDADRLRLRGMRFIDSDRFSPRETRYTASDLASARDSRYTPPNGNQLEKPVSRDSYQPLSHSSRFRDVDEPPLRESRFRGSDQMPRASYTNSTHSRFQRPLESRRAKW